MPHTAVLLGFPVFAGWIGDPPPSGSEVFIGKLPQDIYENQLIPLFQSVGKLYEFRLMMTFSGLNRGFAYAKYSNRHSAQIAIAALNNFEVQKGCPIMVCRSTEKCELCVDGLSSLVEQGQLWTLLQEVTPGVLNISLYPSPSRTGGQFAVLKYNSHRAAAMAKKTLVEGTQPLWGEQAGKVIVASLSTSWGTVVACIIWSAKVSWLGRVVSPLK